MPLTDDQETYLSSLLQGLEPESGKIYERGREFVADQVKRHDEYGQRMFLSPKQLAWLEKLYQEYVDPELPGKQQMTHDDLEDVDRSRRDDREDNKGELPDDMDDEVVF